MVIVYKSNLYKVLITFTLYINIKKYIKMEAFNNYKDNINYINMD